jgi:hypothetical protein
MAIFHCKKCDLVVDGGIYGNKECCGEMTRNIAHYSNDDKLKLSQKCKELFVGRVTRNPKTFQFIPDIQPYQAMAVDAQLGTAPMITSRKAHKEFLKRNGYTEMGNDMPKAQKAEADHDVRPELTQATYEVMRKYR